MNDTATQPVDAILDTLRRATRGDYEVLAELGRGGMAVVYLAHDLALDRKVAIKVMLPALLTAEGAAERFKREARTAASISHPNIIPIYAVKEHEDLLYFVMQFVSGRSLSSVIEQVAPMPIPMIETILLQVGEALAYGHRNGIVHRDVKPGNILLDKEGRAVVTDFGVAKMATDQSITRAGGVVGTPLYMSPEQCVGDVTTGRSDQYSLGLVAYEMLTGRTPFSGENPIQLMYQRCTESPVPVRDLRPDCPTRLADSIMRMLERDSEHRWPTCADAVKAIGRSAGFDSDTIRRQIAELAKTGRSHRILAQMTTPTSPVPASKGSAAIRAHRPAIIASATRLLNWRGGIGWVAAIATAVLGTVWAVSQSLSEPTAVSGDAPPSVAADPDGTPIAGERRVQCRGDFLSQFDTFGLCERIHEEVTVVLTAFGQAVESGDPGRLRQAYAGMSEAEVQHYTKTLPKVEQLTFTVDQAIQVQGSTLIATGRGQFRFRARRLEHTSEYRATLTRTAEALQLASIEFHGQREDIANVLRAFARAVESRDLSAVRGAYPGMSENEARFYANFLPTVEQLTLTIDGPLEAENASLVATGRAHYRYRATESPEGPLEQRGRWAGKPVEFRAVLDSVLGTWQLTFIEFQDP